MPTRVRWCHAEIKSSPRESDDVVGCPCSSKGLTPLVLSDESTVDHSCYIKKVFAAALKYGDEVFGDNLIFQLDGANPQQDYLTQE